LLFQSLRVPFPSQHINAFKDLKNICHIARGRNQTITLKNRIRQLVSTVRELQGIMSNTPPFFLSERGQAQVLLQEHLGKAGRQSDDIRKVSRALLYIESKSKLSHYQELNNKRSLVVTCRGEREETDTLVTSNLCHL
jgi:predicted FMN-binding regulatory protein PaiB